MTASSFRVGKGDVFLIDDLRYKPTLLDRLGIELQAEKSGRPLRYSHVELTNLFFQRRLRVERAQCEALPENLSRNLLRPLEAFPAKDQVEALRRHDYMMVCETAFGNRTAPRTPKGYARIAWTAAGLRRRAAAKETGRWPAAPREIVGGSTLREWHRRWIKAGRLPAALVPLHGDKGDRTKKVDAEAFKIVANMVEDLWLTEERMPLRKVHEVIEARIEQRNDEVRKVDRRAKCLGIPSESTVWRWIWDNVDDYETCLKREGRAAAELRFQQVNRGPRPTRPLQIVEIDHTLLDIMLIKDPIEHKNDRRKGLARAWLTLAICKTTRMIVGFHIGFENPSYRSVMRCLRMGAWKKDDVLDQLDERWKTEEEWPVYGIPETVVVDNGKDFHSNSLRAAAAHLGFELRYTPSRKPKLKGTVERFFGEVARDFLAFLPGKTFASIHERGDNKPALTANLQIGDIRQAFAFWLVDIYQRRPHRGLFRQCPIDAWRNLEGYSVKLPQSAADIELSLAPVVDRTIQKYGVEHMGLLYQSRELSDLRKTQRSKLWSIKLLPEDLSRIHVLDEANNRWLEVPCNDTALTTGLTADDWKLIMEDAKQHTRRGEKVRTSEFKKSRDRLIKAGIEFGAGRKDRWSDADREWFFEEQTKVVGSVGVEPGEDNVAPDDQKRRTASATVEKPPAIFAESETEESPARNGSTGTRIRKKASYHEDANNDD